MAGVGRNYDAARDSAGWTWDEAQRAAKERWGATKSKTKQTWDQVRRCVLVKSGRGAPCSNVGVICDFAQPATWLPAPSVQLPNHNTHLTSVHRPATPRGPTGCGLALPPAPAGMSCRWGLLQGRWAMH
jgi:hypothetical protein